MKWFKHDSNAHSDAKLKRVKHRYGMVGYGLYWYCVELIAGRVDKNNIRFELEEDAEIIALEWNLDQLKIEEMMRYFVEIDLFESNENVITCLKLAKRLDDTNAKNPEIRKIINSLNQSEILGETPNQSEGVGKSPNDSAQTRLDKTRLDKTKQKKENAHAALAEKLGVDLDLIGRVVKHRRDIKHPANTDKKISIVIGDLRKCVEAGLFSDISLAMDRLDESEWRTLKPEYLEKSGGKSKHASANQAVEDFVNGNY